MYRARPRAAPHTREGWLPYLALLVLLMTLAVAAGSPSWAPDPPALP